MATNEIIYELKLEEPSEELLQWAKENINENLDERDLIVSDFRDMIYSRGECTPHRMDDEFLLRFLRARNFIIERAHRLFVNYYAFKSNNPEFCKDVDLDELTELGKENLIVVPPYKDGSGRRILNYRVAAWDPEKYTVDQVFQATIAILELAVMEPEVQILGGICIIDFQNLSMQQAWYMTPSLARKIVQIMVTSFPLRIHAIHIVNQSYIFDFIYNIFKPFLNDTMKEKVFFHGENLESLHNHIDPKYLPKCYGGIHQDYNYRNWIDNCRKNKKVIKELRDLGYIVVDSTEP